MRRWVCILTLLAGFGGDARTPRRGAPTPVPMVRPLAPSDGLTARTIAWWLP